MKISIVCPAYNEEECLPRLIPKLDGVLSATGEEYEIVIVDDGSTDGTGRVLRELVPQYPALRTIELAENVGQTAAWVAGFRSARGDVVVTIDADLQNDPEDIPDLLAQLGEFDVVSGIRQGRQDSWSRKMGSRIGNGVRNWLTGDQVTDVGCSLRAIKKEFLDGLPMVKNMHRFMPTLLKMQGARCTQVPVRHHPRTLGVSKYGNWGRLWQSLHDLMGVRWMLTRWIRYEIKWDSAEGSDEGSQNAEPAEDGSTC